MKWYKIVVLFCISIFLTSSFHSVTACKDIVACGTATMGDYNLLLKVRDPSRPGYQVLTQVPAGYTYEYHHPWTGKPIPFQFNHSMIGVASVGDTLPNIVKTGMCFTSAGLSFGDADANSNWRNPSVNAWDDFDWIRFAAQTANNEDEAVDLLTKISVDQLHASGVPENLFVVGPDKGFVIEADFFHYEIKEIIDNVTVMSNYVKDLWQKSFFLRMFAPSFDSIFHGEVMNGQVIRLGKGCIYGIKIVNVNADSIEVKQVPIQFSKDNIIGRTFDLFSTTTIQQFDNETVGFFRVGLENVTGERAIISLCYEYFAWEEEMLDIIKRSMGSISALTMMNWSRIHESDIDGLRGMCDDHEVYPYEGCMIFQIPRLSYDLLSVGWFAANHACSSIYVPVHICTTRAYEPYTTGEAAELSFKLLGSYGHDVLSDPFNQIEQVFINELEDLNPLIMGLINDPVNLSWFLTTVDVGMQKQAFLTQQLWMNLSSEEMLYSYISLFSSIWDTDYSLSLFHMKHICDQLDNDPSRLHYIHKIIDISLSILDTKLHQCKILGFQDYPAELHLGRALYNFNNGHYQDGFSDLLFSYNRYAKLL